MRVLQLLSSTGFHGAETMAVELTRQLHALGVSIDIGVFDNAGDANQEILQAAAPYIRQSVVIPCRGQLDWSTVRFLREWLVSHRVDLIHSHKYKSTFYALLARRGTPCRLLATYHNWLTDTWALRCYTALDKRLARYCDGAVAVSEPVAAELRHHAAPNKVWQIGNGVDPLIFRRTMPCAEAKQLLGLRGKTVVGFVGRLSADKGLSHLFQALAALPGQFAESVHAVVVGDGDYGGVLAREAETLGLANRVHFLGHRRGTLMLYSAFDAFVLPSLREAFPMVVLEAMSCGLPVIATRVGDVERIIEHGVSGLIVPPADSGALRQALHTLLTQPERAEAMGQAARERMVRQFSSAHMAREYLALYERILSESRRVSAAV